MYVVKHTYDTPDGGQKEDPVAVYDSENDAYEYADLYSDIRAYALCDTFCPTFGDLDVDECETEKDVEDWYGVPFSSIPYAPKEAPDFSFFEKKRNAFLKTVSAMKRFPKLTVMNTENPEKYEGRNVYSLIDPDAGSNIIYRKNGFCNRIGHAILDRDPVMDATELGTIRLSDEFGFCLTDLEPVYENVVFVDESTLPPEPMSFKDAYAFADKAYKAYQLHWMALRGYGLSDLEKVIRKITVQELVDEDYVVTADNAEIFADSVKEMFEMSAGFGGSIFACRDEFIRNEFQDPDYMRILLSFMGENKWVIGTWREAVKTINTGHLYATSIVWDTDGEDVDLPEEIEIPDPEWDDQQISDYITEETGFCHRGFALVQR